MAKLQTLRSQYQTAQEKMEMLYKHLGNARRSGLTWEFQALKVCDDLADAIEVEENALRIGAYYPLCVWI